MSLPESSSSTIRLSLGLRPVFLPEYEHKAPAEEITVPTSCVRASSYNTGTDGLCLMVTYEKYKQNEGVLLHDAPYIPCHNQCRPFHEALPPLWYVSKTKTWDDDLLVSQGDTREIQDDNSFLMGKEKKMCTVCVCEKPADVV